MPCDIKDTECWRNLGTYTKKTTLDKASQKLDQTYDRAKDFARSKAQDAKEFASSKTQDAK